MVDSADVRLIERRGGSSLARQPTWVVV